MLKIKDNVDLKELEKFGFVFNQYNYVYLNGKYLVTVFIDFDRFIITALHDSTLLTDLELYTNILFDLIQAGLVDKVEV